MFINEKTLKKLMMQAFKQNGLFMANYDGYIYLADAFYYSWKAKIAVGHVPNTILGGMAECAGAIPENGDGWTAAKDGLQMEMREAWHFSDPDREGYEIPEVTPLYVQSRAGTLYRVLQLANGACMAVKPELLGAIEPRSIDRGNEETMIKGPFYDGQHNIFAYTNQAQWSMHINIPTGTASLMDILGNHTLQFDEEED